MANTVETWIPLKILILKQKERIMQVKKWRLFQSRILFFSTNQQLRLLVAMEEWKKALIFSYSPAYSPGSIKHMQYFESKVLTQFKTTEKTLDFKCIIQTYRNALQINTISKTVLVFGLYTSTHSDTSNSGWPLTNGITGLKLTVFWNLSSQLTSWQTSA